MPAEERSRRRWREGVTTLWEQYRARKRKLDTGLRMVARRGPRIDTTTFLAVEFLQQEISGLRQALGALAQERPLSTSRSAEAGRARGRGPKSQRA